MTRDEMAEDLSYVRALAEQGRQAPLVGGAFLVLFGSLLAATYAAHWLVTQGVLGPMPAFAPGIVWLGFGIAAGVGSSFVRARLRSKPGGASIANKIDRVVWRAAAFAIVATVVGSLAAMAVHNDPNAPNVIMASGFACYAIALITTATIAEKAWLNWFGVAALAVSALLWVYANEPWAYLAASVASLIVLLLPGLLMVRQEPASVV